MLEELQPDSRQFLEKIISTVFTCRSVIKYNSNLNEEQKNELITDVDACLHSLRANFTTHKKIQTPQPQSQFQHISSVMLHAVKELNSEKHRYAVLQELYRIYHAYIDTQQSNNISTFATRFDAVVLALDEVQGQFAICEDVCKKSAEDDLQRIRTFIADLYYMFMELVRTLSNALESNGGHRETEKSVSLRHHFESTEMSTLQIYFAPLSHVFLEHQRLNEMKGTLSRRISDSRAFLLFMRESLENDFHKREEILTHLNNVALLLEDLAYVLSGYEDAADLLLKSGKE